MENDTDGTVAGGDARPGDFVQSLERGLAVIRAFDAEHPRLSLSDVARRTDLSRAAARRFLRTLVELGYVGTDGREYFPRPSLLDLGYAYLSGLPLPALARPHLEELSARTHESSSLAVLDGDDIVYVERVAVRRIIAAAIGIGTRLPAYVTSMGRVLLACDDRIDLGAFLAQAPFPARTATTLTTAEELGAELGRVRAQGWSLVDEELEAGLRSVAAPVLDARGRVVAAVNVAAPARSGSDHVREVVRAAEEIGADLARLPS